MKSISNINQTVGYFNQLNDLMDLLYISQLAFKRRRTDEFQKQVIDLLLPMFKVDAANFFLVNQENRLSFEKVVSSGIDEMWQSHFRRHYIKYDPFRKGIHRHTVCTLEQVISHQDLIKSAYYNDFLRPQSIHSQLCINLRPGRQLLGIIALFRFIGKPAFSPEEKRKAHRIAPYLSRALETSIVLERDAMRQSIMNSIASEIENKGIILLNEHYDIVYTDNRARKIISLLIGNDTTAGIEYQSLPDPLSQCLKDFSSRNSRITQYYLSLKDAKQHVGVTIKHEVSADTAFYKIILKPEKSLLAEERLFEFGLTARQSEVATFVCKGLSSKEISSKLCISPYTVENHLRKIYAKMNVRSRTRLTHLILSQTNAPA